MNIPLDTQPSTASVLALAVGLLLGRKARLKPEAPANKVSDTKESSDDRQQQD
jgi:hypothetical protein